MDLVVPIGIMSGVNSTTSATPVLQRVFFRIDTTKHDGTVTYKLVCMVRLSNLAQTGTVEVKPSGGGTTVGTATHTGNQLESRIEGTVTPTAGSNVYDLYLSVTGGVTFYITSAYIEVTQVGATKTQFTIPLVGQTSDGQFTGGPTEGIHASRFLYTAANWNNATFKMATRGTNGGAGTCTIDLFDGTSALGSTTHSTSPADYQESGDLTLTDGAEHYPRGTASAGTDNLASAHLIVTLSALDKFEIHHKVGQRRATHLVDWLASTTGSTLDAIAARRIIDASLITAGAIAGIFFEAVGFSAAAADTIILKKAGANDNGTTGTTVSTLTITSGTKQRLRSADLLSGWANERYFAALVKSANAGQADGYSATVILVIVASTPIVADRLTIVTQPVDTVVGQVMAPIVVEAHDEAEDIDTTFYGPVTLAWGTNPGSAPAPAGTLTVTMVEGVAVFDDIVVSTLQVYATFVITDDSSVLLEDESEPFHITAPPSGGGSGLLRTPLVRGGE